MTASPEHPPCRTIAVFDFDDTLVKGDSFFPFLIYIAGLPKVLAVLMVSLVTYHLSARFRGEELRTYIKNKMLKEIVKGKKLSDLTHVTDRMHKEVLWLDPQLYLLRDHHQKGHHIVIASGGLDLYLPALLRNIPHHALICTDVGIKDGVITGDMIHGNCVRFCKAERVRAYMESQGGFDDSWGYGNAPHDLPMLALMKHQTVV